MRHVFLSLSLVLVTAGCGDTFQNPFDRFKKSPEPEPAVIEQPSEPGEPMSAIPEIELGTAGASPEALDTASVEETEAAKAATPSGGVIGTTVASLGNPAEPGFWLRTPLVSEETEGVVESAGGARVTVTLIPIAGDPGAGSRLSLSAMRALDFDLTDLPALTVYKG